jgi:phosphoglycerate dehydrogenase-like enzyme
LQWSWVVWQPKAHGQQKGLTVATTPNENKILVADHVTGYLLKILRNTSKIAADQLGTRWTQPRISILSRLSEETGGRGLAGISAAECLMEYFGVQRRSEFL